MSRRQSERKVVPKLRHEEAAQHLVEYHFGRLSPAMSAAVEAHVRGCRVCQRQGLAHAATEKRQIDRRIRRLKPGGPRKLSRRGRTFILLLIVIVLIQVAVIQIATGTSSPFARLLGGGLRLGSGHTPIATSTTHPAPAALAPSTVYDPAVKGSEAITMSPDGKMVAIARMADAAPQVAVWLTSGSKPAYTLAWPSTAAPGVMAWSPDSTSLAVADGTTIAVWTVSSSTPTWSVTLPAAPALRVYSVPSASVIQRPDAATAFAHGSTLKWTSDGQVVPAQPDAAAVPAPSSGVVGLWRASGSHIFSDGKAGAEVGISATDASAGEALLDWSPDGQYLLWASTSQPLAPPVTSASPATTATLTSTPNDGAGSATSAALTPPDAIVARAAANVASSGHADALVWFSPNGQLVAQCDRTTPGAALTLYDVATARPLAAMPAVCDGLTLSSLAWTTASNGVLVAVPGKTAALYPLALTRP